MSTTSDSNTLSAQVNKLNLAESPSASPPTEPSELVAVVDDLLNQLTSKFTHVSSEIVGKMDEMSKRLDALENQIQAVHAQAESVSGGEEK